jgi:hypothetical protein
VKKKTRMDKEGRRIISRRRRRRLGQRKRRIRPSEYKTGTQH